MAKYYVTMKINARYTVEVYADSIDEAKKKAEYEFSEADFGVAKDINGECIIVEDVSMREHWEEEHSMDEGNEVLQWVYKDKIMVDKCADGKYIVNIYYDDDFVYFDIKFNTLQDAMNFVEDVWM